MLILLSSMVGASFILFKETTKRPSSVNAPSTLTVSQALSVTRTVTEYVGVDSKLRRAPGATVITPVSLLRVKNVNGGVGDTLTMVYVSLPASALFGSVPTAVQITVPALLFSSILKD
jgi:hypothetical protein